MERLPKFVLFREIHTLQNLHLLLTFSTNYCVRGPSWIKQPFDVLFWDHSLGEYVIK